MSALPICIYCKKSFASQRELNLHEEREQCTLQFSVSFLQGNQPDQTPEANNLPSDAELADPIGADSIDSPMAIDLPITEEQEAKTSDIFTGKFDDQCH